VVGVAELDTQGDAEFTATLVLQGRFKFSLDLIQRPALVVQEAWNLDRGPDRLSTIPTVAG
jgi:hypothetical protein